MLVLDGELTLVVVLDGELGIFHGIAGDYEEYSGETEVIPKAFSETILLTNGKLMPSDVTVIKIPYHETSNQSGKTVYIASEV